METISGYNGPPVPAYSEGREMWCVPGSEQFAAGSCAVKPLGPDVELLPVLTDARRCGKLRALTASLTQSRRRVKRCLR